MSDFGWTCSALGFCWILYSISKIIHLYVLWCEDQKKGNSLFVLILVLLSLLLKLFSFPVSVFSGIIEQKYSDRFFKQLDRNMAIAELKFLCKCDHCENKKISQKYSFGYDSYNRVWTNKSHEYYSENTYEPDDF